MNKVFLIGNLTKAPSGGETASGKAFAKLSLAVNRPYASDGDIKADFFTVTVWNGAEACLNYLTKGSKVAIVGSLQNRSYEDKDGNKRQVTDIIANEVEFLSKVERQEEDTLRQEPKAYQPINEEDLPF
jgi:single-strand DNA-binding protein